MPGSGSPGVTPDRHRGEALAGPVTARAGGWGRLGAAMGPGQLLLPRVQQSRVPPAPGRRFAAPALLPVPPEEPGLCSGCTALPPRA